MMANCQSALLPVESPQTILDGFDSINSEPPVIKMPKTVSLNCISLLSQKKVLAPTDEVAQRR